MNQAEIVEVVLGTLTALAPLLHLLRWASNPWARVVLSIIPDVVGAVRRAQGKAGAAQPEPK